MTVSYEIPWRKGREMSEDRVLDIDGEPKIDIATDGACGLSWDNAIITGMTPAPSARCPFEYFHEYDDDGEPVPLELEDIPEDFVVRPMAAESRFTFSYFGVEL